MIQTDKEIKKEFILKYLPFFQDQKLEREDMVYPYDSGVSTKIVNDQIQKRTMGKANEVANYFLDKINTLQEEYKKETNKVLKNILEHGTYMGYKEDIINIINNK